MFKWKNLLLKKNKQCTSVCSKNMSSVINCDYSRKNWCNRKASFRSGFLKNFQIIISNGKSHCHKVNSVKTHLLEIIAELL